MPEREQLDRLTTEGRLDVARDLDQLPTQDQVRLLHSQDEVAVAVVAEAGSAIAAAVDTIVARMARGGRMLYVGAGTSGALALIDAAECPVTFGVAPETVQAVSRADPERLRTHGYDDAEDDAAAGRSDLDAVAPASADTIVGISASGRTPYVIGAMERARELDAMTVAVVSTSNSRVAQLAAHVIEIPTGPEVIAGSTRLKSGTAQKLVLNALSTLTMVQRGNTLGDLMVGLRATNDKQRRRLHRVVAQATGADPDAIAAALDATGGEAKVAIVMLLTEVGADEAERRLRAAEGHVRRAATVATVGAEGNHAGRVASDAAGSERR